MIISPQTFDSPHGLSFTVDVTRCEGGPSIIWVHTLGMTVRVCEANTAAETERRWHNTIKDLLELQQIGEQQIARGNPKCLVESAFRRLRDSRGIPNLNYLD